MRHYEVMVILDPSLDERTVGPSLDNMLNVVKTEGGKVDKVDVWGKRRLAYAVKKHTDGYYVLVNFEADPAEIKEIDRVMKINDEILRHLIVKHEA